MSRSIFEGLYDYFCAKSNQEEVLQKHLINFATWLSILSATLIMGRLVNVESYQFLTLIISFCPVWENDSWIKTVAVCHPHPGVNVKTTFF
jgi:hypothetical protein